SWPPAPSQKPSAFPPQPPETEPLQLHPNFHHVDGHDRRTLLRGCEPCGACQGPCADCPARLHRPETLEVWQIRDLLGRLGGQLRVLPGAVIGWDLNAALSLGDALGLASAAMAELLPVIEAVMVHKLNGEMATDGGPAISP
ncbi:DUF7697 family protein, partial [Aurantimonas sp. A3-2-R12]|uniref:DUF7697 family protein n=1 Tax=Aurantimonas sp. A3-2-R12 TaxID=3114362 RepID=UPI002E1963C1|nr:hypothetical protein [Aurantimonas sp. A3-2-R12]